MVLGGIYLDKRVYLLTTIAFIVGMVELIIGGVLDLVAHDLGVSIGQKVCFKNVPVIKHDLL